MVKNVSAFMLSCLACLAGCGGGGGGGGSSSGPVQPPAQNVIISGDIAPEPVVSASQNFIQEAQLSDSFSSPPCESENYVLKPGAVNDFSGIASIPRKQMQKLSLAQR